MVVLLARPDALPDETTREPGSWMDPTDPRILWVVLGDSDPPTGYDAWDGFGQPSGLDSAGGRRAILDDPTAKMLQIVAGPARSAFRDCPQEFGDMSELPAAGFPIRDLQRRIFELYGAKDEARGRLGDVPLAGRGVRRAGHGLAVGNAGRTGDGDGRRPGLARHPGEYPRGRPRSGRLAEVWARLPGLPIDPLPVRPDSEKP